VQIAGIFSSLFASGEAPGVPADAPNDLQDTPDDLQETSDNLQEYIDDPQDTCQVRQVNNKMTEYSWINLSFDEEEVNTQLPVLEYIMAGIVLALNVVAPEKEIRVKKGPNLYLTRETLEAMKKRDAATGKRYRSLRNESKQFQHVWNMFR
jgi:hypothetical protein